MKTIQKTVTIKLFDMTIECTGDYTPTHNSGEENELIPPEFSVDIIKTEKGEDITDFIFQINEYYFAQARKMLKNIGLTDVPAYRNMDEVQQLIEFSCLRKIENLIPQEND